MAGAVRNGGTIRFDDSADNYDARHTFRDDCNTLRSKLATIKEILAPLGFPIPRATFNRGQLEVPARSFARQMQSDPEHFKAKASLVAATLDLDVDGEHLVPRNTALFLGFGTTVFMLVEEMLRRHDEFQNSIYTANFEAAILLYLSSPRALSNGDARLCLPGCELNWTAGTVYPAGQMLVDTAVVSVDAIGKGGVLYSENSHTEELTNEALSTAQRRVILVADHKKIGRGTRGGQEIKLTGLEKDPSVYFVTDKEMPSEYRPPDNVNLIVT